MSPEAGLRYVSVQLLAVYYIVSYTATMNYTQKQEKLITERNQRIRELREKGVKVSEIAKLIGIHRAQVYRVLGAVDKTEINGVA